MELKCHYKPALLVLLCTITSLCTHAQAFLSKPIAGVYGKEYIIVNYVDWGTDTLIYDHSCGTKSYNGHEGTDFVIRNFKLMDSGVNVLAAANGIVTYTKDGLFDREKSSTITKKLGNYIAIKHNNGYYSYYGHLAKGSIKVKVGDSVNSGQIIGKVGSSGNSTDPHLHFELWWDSLYVVDPFKGHCGNTNTLWLSPDTYDTTFRVWQSSMCSFKPYLDTLREEPKSVYDFFKSDSVINYWAILYGLKNGDSLTIKWYDPSGIEWFANTYYLTQDAWYYYYWNYIDIPIKTGKWKVILLRNNVLVDTVLFNYYNTTKVTEKVVGKKLLFYPNPANNQLTVDDKPLEYEILNLNGVVVQTGFGNEINIEKLNPSSYMLIYGHNVACFYKL